ncbi:MAG TPA: xanthine dehydrogenase family protein molybdopterin-binding subunit [Longimicrobiales bacterium]|nr:xanthine dehydrogenase family protein molybdopterin-binding subunit [Longimicrobiales bacterium]
MSPRQSAPQVAPLSTVGRDTPRIDGYERVTGRAAYTGDLRLPGMLYARVLRSPHPHARIRSIDVSRARALPGVRAVITHETHPDVVYGSGSIAGGRQYSDAAKDMTLHKRYMFDNPVRHVGQPVAAVAAVDRHVAEEALELIDIDWEELPFVLDVEEALEPAAPRIWPEGNVGLDFRNEARPITSVQGDPTAGFAAADRVFEDRYTTAFVHDAQMEPRTTIAHWEGDKLVLHTPTQGISNCRHDNAKDLGLEDHEVQVVCQYMGGGFGDKNGSYYFDLIAAMLSREVGGAPVMVELTRKDDWLGTHGRWHTVQDLRVGVTANGTLTAIELRARSGMGPYLRRSGSLSGIDAYACPNVERVIYPVHTNRMVSGNFRGPSEPQGYFPIQSMMDGIAYDLGMDPVDFALKNMLRPTDEIRFTNYTLDQCIERGADLFDWPSRWRPEPGSDPGPVKRGAGMSFMMFRSGVGPSSAILRVDSSGRFTAFVGVTDIGPGAKTTMAMIAAEELGVPLSMIDVVWGDTDRCPYSVGESGSRTTIMTGYAVVEAARDLKRQIADRGMPQGDAVLIASATPTPSTQGMRRNCFGAHFVEVEVDTELGRTRVTKYVAVHESGRILNPLPARDQIRGAAIQGIGQALHEDLLYDFRNGQPLTTGYYGARHVTHLDVPEIEVTFIEDDDGFGPFGAKTVGEAGIILAPSAVANAIFNAIGVRMKDLPITRARILEALA